MAAVLRADVCRHTPLCATLRPELPALAVVCSALDDVIDMVAHSAALAQFDINTDRVPEPDEDSNADADAAAAAFPPLGAAAGVREIRLCVRLATVNCD